LNDLFLFKKTKVIQFNGKNKRQTLTSLAPILKKDLNNYLIFFI